MSEQICCSRPFLASLPSCKNARPVARLKLKRVLVGLVALGAALAPVCSPAAAKYKWRYRPAAMEHGAMKRAAEDPFAGMPKGPLQVFISINQQRLHFYSGGVHVADVPVATGVPDHPTPRGVFDVIQRDRYHRSNIYSDAPMPYMERITWSGIALHEGEGVGHEASHGCIRMPHYFAAGLWHLPTMGMRVVITGAELRPTVIADPHLFVHKDKPTPVAPLTAQVAAAQPLGTKTDVGQPGSAVPPAAPERPGEAADADATSPSVDRTRNPADAPPRTESGEAGKSAAVVNPMTAPIALADVPLPRAKPEQLVRIENAPLAIFISRKLRKIFVRQNFEPLLEAPVKIENPGQPLGTRVFTALNYLPDHATLRWNVVSLPGEPVHFTDVTAYGRRKRVRARADEEAAAETPQQALSRITIPQGAIDQISRLIVPGSSLIISDQGLGVETGKGTDFIVIEP